MKAAYLVIALVVIVAAASGTYIWATRSLPESPSHGAQPARSESAEALQTVKNQTESPVTKVENETPALEKSQESPPAAESPVAPPTEQGSVAREPRREDGRATVEERDRQKRERMFDEMLTRFTTHANSRIQRLADRRGWNDEKRQSVTAIMTEHQEEVRKLIETTRQAGTVEPGMRDIIADKIRNISLGTVEKLRTILTPEEVQEVQRVLEPPRRIVEPVPETPAPGPEETTPPEPEPGQ